MAVKTIRQNKIVWHHIDTVDDRALDFLSVNFKFHPLDLKDVQGASEESKIDVYKNYIFLIFHFPILHRSIGRIESMELIVFLSHDYLVTVQKGKFKAMRDLYYKMQNSAKYRKAAFGNAPAYLLYKLLDALYRDARNITDYFSKKLCEIEDEVYSNEMEEQTARRIAYLRRKILSMKRIFDPQREVLGRLSQMKTNFLPEDMNVYFDDIDDYIEKVSNFLENTKYMVKDLLEVHDSLMTHKTNKIIKLLTVISVGMLPLTLLSGIYGMNIRLPFNGHPLAVWSMFFALLALIAAVVWVMKRRKLL